MYEGHVPNVLSHFQQSLLGQYGLRKHQGLQDDVFSQVQNQNTV